MSPGPDPAVAAALAEAHRREWGFVLAATLRVTRDLDLAEECVQDAYTRALGAWSRDGVPTRPGAWLTTTARRRALDLHRRADVARRALPDLVPPPDEAVDPSSDIPDDRLRLIFTCCHPELALEARTALTLRLVCGMTTAEVARAFLVNETTMAARITRAKKRITALQLPYRVPSRDELPDRLDAVLTVVHLIFTTGHTAPAGEQLVRRDLVERAVELARILSGLLPHHADVAGLLALILLTDARRPGRVENGAQVLLPDQDRDRWDRAAIAEGVELVRTALARRPPGKWALMAAIAAVHDESPSFGATDWAQIVGLYDLLGQLWPSPIVALNRAVAVGFARGPQAGLEALAPLADEPQLAPYGYLAAARAEFLARLGRTPEARAAYDEAILLTENAVERASLLERVSALPADEGGMAQGGTRGGIRKRSGQ